VEFEWDDQKAESNLRKHGISFSFATEVFDDKNRVFKLDSRRDYGEERWVSVGFAVDRLVLVVYTEAGDTVRIISARPPSKKERKGYDDRQI